MTVFVHTQGCKVNQYETQAIREILEKNGYDVENYIPGMADIGGHAILINSCTVTGESDRKLRQFIRRCRREHPSSIIILTGCFSQAFPKEAASIQEVDILLGNSKRSIIADVLSQYQENHQRIINIDSHTKEYEPLCIHSFDERTRAFLKIQDGCDCFCTYCIIPYSRGRIRSDSLENIQKESQSLALQGYKEIVLTGINLTAFGRGTDIDLSDAVSTVASVNGIERIRLGSLEPDDMTPELIKKLAKEPKLCPQFHVSLQSGCTETLKRMHRRYTAEEYATVCHNLRKAFIDCSLTTDVMVGFAGETEEEFQQSYDFVQSIGFEKIHVFPYSIRPGTAAAKFPNQLTNTIKNDRCRKMIALGNKLQKAFFKDYIGKTVEILTEIENSEGYTEGYTKNYIPVHVKGHLPHNTLVKVEIEKEENGVCYAISL